MTQSKKELVFAAMDNKPVDRVPSGFWFHFLQDEIHSDSFQHPELFEQLYAGETRYIDTVQPDFVKIMTDGFFPYENPTAFGLETVEDFKHIVPLKDDDPWFTVQIGYAKKLSERYGKDIPLFYNLFCAGTTLKFMRKDIFAADAWLSKLVLEDPAAVKQGLDVISGDIAKLAKRLITEGGVTGIYLSLQNLLGEGINEAIYQQVLAPGEKAILAAANSVSDYNILHICGWSGHRNDLTWYKDYEVKTINWAAVVEGVPLEEGRKIFGGRAALGGFATWITKCCTSAPGEKIQAETKRILEKAGRTGIILGADCTVPRDTNWEHFAWVREAAK